MSSMEQNDERRILGQMVRFQNQAAVRIDNDRVNRREIDLNGTNPRSQGQEKEKKRLFHFAFHAQLHGLTRTRSATAGESKSGLQQMCVTYQKCGCTLASGWLHRMVRP